MIRDRVRELRRVRAGDLIPNQKNWRTHPAAQRDALAGILAEVGYAGAIITRETDAGLQIIDGHLRAETTPDELVPVLVLDVTAQEADKLLLAFDPLSAMAEANRENLDALLREVQTGNSALAELFTNLAVQHEIIPAESEGANAAAQLPAGTFEIVVTCGDEDDQRSLFDRLAGEGYQCRVLTF